MKLLPEKKWPIEGEDYGFVDTDGVDKVTSIRILKGKFEGVLYHYGTIEVVEEDPPRIKFDYFLDDPGKFEFKDLQSNKKFDTMMGDILVSIFDNNILKKKELDDEAGTDDTEEFNLQ
jgi:hypothetical protein